MFSPSPLSITNLSEDVIHTVLEGGTSTCAEVGIPLAVGHFIHAPTPMVSLDCPGRGHGRPAGEEMLAARCGRVLRLVTVPLEQ